MRLAEIYATYLCAYRNSNHEYIVRTRISYNPALESCLGDSCTGLLHWTPALCSWFVINQCLPLMYRKPQVVVVYHSLTTIYSWPAWYSETEIFQNTISAQEFAPRIDDFFSSIDFFFSQVRFSNRVSSRCSDLEIYAEHNYNTICTRIYRSQSTNSDERETLRRSSAQREKESYKKWRKKKKRGRLRITKRRRSHRKRDRPSS